jgi:hypothetical protein
MQFKNRNWKLPELVAIKSGRKAQYNMTKAKNAATNERAAAARAKREKRPG